MSSGGPISGRGGNDAARGGSEASALIPGFAPETDLERRLSEDPELRAGWAWGKPRSGHPEGTVGAHVSDLLRTIDEWGERGERRRELRVLALLHDTLKYEVSYVRPRTGENHHAMRARRVGERYLNDERLLATLELHDRPYAIWRAMRRTGRLDRDRLDEMLSQIPDIDLFQRFVQLDASTEGKTPEPFAWFREQLEERAGEREGRGAGSGNARSDGGLEGGSLEGGGAVPEDGR